MRRLVLVATVVASVPAFAEDFTPRTAQARLEGVTARIDAHYVFDVAAGYDEGIEQLEIPIHGIVTGAVVRVDGAVHRLTLDPADRADAKFTAVGDRAGGADREWAVRISLESSAGIRVEVAAPHPARMLLDLEISSSTCFFRDARYALIPIHWQSLFGASYTPRDEGAVDTACENPESSSFKWLAFPSRELALLPFGEQRIGTLGSRLVLDSHDIARVEIDLSREISHVPPDLYTAILIDGSRSMTSEQVDTQRAIVSAYLRAAPHGQVQIIEYDRDPHAMLPAWTIASEAAAQVARALDAMNVHNGSNVDRGLAEAGTWLARTTGTRRVVVFTDELFGQRLAAIPPVSLRTQLPDNTLVHVIALEDDPGELDRDDTALLAPLAAATEGMAFHGRNVAEGKVDATKLVRPIALEHLGVQAPGWTIAHLGVACDEHDDLPEGNSCSWLGDGGVASGPIRIDGLLWGHHVVRVVRPDPSQGRSLARSISAMGSGFESELMLQIDRAAFAVNAVWSLFGSWGGHDGYADLMHGGGGWGMSGCGCDGSTIGSSIGGGGMGALVPPTLEEQLERGIRRCMPGDAQFDVHLELTLQEIVDLSVTMQRGEPELQRCIESSVWDTILTLPTATAHSTVTVAFGA